MGFLERACTRFTQRANQKKGSTSYILEPDREITPWIKKNMGGSGTIDIPKNLIDNRKSIE